MREIRLHTSIKKGQPPFFFLLSVIPKAAAALFIVFYAMSGTAQAAATVVTSTGTVADATGRGYMSHVIYAVKDAAWWAFYIDSANGNQLKVRRSTDLISWSAATAFTLTNNHNSEGMNIELRYRYISGYDVVHIQMSYAVSATNHRSYHIRATISGGAIAFGAENLVNNVGTMSYTYPIDDASVGFDTNNKIYMIGGFNDAGGLGNPAYSISTNADTGAAWTAGFGTYTVIETVNDVVNSSFITDLAGGNMLGIWDDGQVGGGNFTSLRWSKWNGASWSAPASIYTITGVAKNNWGALAISTTDVHVITRTGANTFNHYSFNGTSWSAKAAPPNQTSKDNSGIFLAIDGKDLWLFIIDSDASNTVRYCKYRPASNSWDSWTVLEASSKTRNNISGYPIKSGDTIAVSWSQVNGGNYDYVVASLVGARRKILFMDN
jgi:hypothetical protein